MLTNCFNILSKLTAKLSFNLTFGESSKLTCLAEISYIGVQLQLSYVIIRCIVIVCTHLVLCVLF